MSKNSAAEGKSLAEQICDGEPIQWSPTTDAPESTRRAALQLLDTISRTFRDTRLEGHGIADGKTWGSLQLIQPLGVGSYGTVYRAFDPLLKREVALKLAHIEGGQARQWINEARRLARITHPNVVAIHGAEIHEGRAGIWFERIEGPSLQQWISQHGCLGAGELGAVGQSLCAALAAVHGAGLVHGDIKPANILREIGGRIVLLDFGSSREVGAETLASGSPAYLAPELLEAAPPSIASDVFALGMTLRYLLVGHVPEANSKSGLLDERPDLPRALLHSIEAACASDPSQRPATAGAFAHALAKSIDAPATPPRRRPQAARAAIYTLAAVVLAGIFLVARSWLQPTPALLSDVSLVTRDASGTAQTVTQPLQVGAPLALRISSTQALFVYVLNQDDQGHSHVLYPLAPATESLPPGKDIELPGRVGGQAMDWQVDSSSAQERFAVIAAMQRLPELERRLANWPRAGELSSADGQAVRGVGGLVNKPPVDAANLDDLVGSLTSQAGVEVHLLELSAH